MLLESGVNMHCQGSRSCCLLLHGVEPTFLVGISHVWESPSDLQILQGPRTLAVPVVSVAHRNCASWPLLYLRFAEGVGMLWAWGKQNVLQTFLEQASCGLCCFLKYPLCLSSEVAMQIQLSGVCLVSLNHKVDQFLFVCHLRMIYHKA